MKSVFAFVIFVTGVSGFFLFSSPVTHAATFIVATTTDIAATDNVSGDGFCADTDGDCTLRAAIEEANALAGTDSIVFTIPGGGTHTISPTSNMPPISDAVSIDGTTQSSSSCGNLWAGTTRTLNIIIDGGNARTQGLSTIVSNSTIKGISFINFPTNATVIGIGGSGSNTTVACNNINGGQIGISAQSVSGLTIGGSAAGDGNVIGDLLVDGINFGTDVTGSTVEGNFVGVDIAGTTAHSTEDGIWLGGGSTGNIIRHNLSSGNTHWGIDVAASDNTIVGNYVGVNRLGTAAIPNQNDGIKIFDSDGNTIGGEALEDRNVISGNKNSGIGIENTATSVAIVNNYIGVDSGGVTNLCNGNPDPKPQIGDEAAGTVATGNTYGSCEGGAETSLNTSFSPSNMVTTGTELSIVTADAPDSGAGTFSMYVCKTTGATLSGCDGGPSDTWCSATGATDDPSCSFTPTSDDIGVNTAYTYIFKTDYDIPTSPVTSAFAINAASVVGSNTATFLVSASGDNGTAYKSESGVPTFDIDGADLFSFLFTGRTQAFPSEDEVNILSALLRWDTSSLPDNATITSASFGCYVFGGLFNAGGRNLTADWYSGAFDETAYSETPQTSALTSYALSSISIADSLTLNTIPLDTVTGVSLTGDTGLRLHVDGEVPSDVGGIISCATYGSRNPASLTVTYTVPAESEDNPPSPHSGGGSGSRPTGTSTPPLLPATHSDGLSAGQINALLNILKSFGADSNTLAKVLAILSGQSGQGAGGGTAFVFTHDLYLGFTHPDVPLLQHYLNTHGFPLASAGPGSLNQEVLTFGPKTQAALSKYQTAHNITPAIGYFGVKTQEVLNKGL